MLSKYATANSSVHNFHDAGSVIPSYRTTVAGTAGTTAFVSGDKQNYKGTTNGVENMDSTNSAVGDHSSGGG